MTVRSFLLPALLLLAAAAPPHGAFAQVTIDVTETNQVIRGLGYSQAFQRAARVYNTMSHARQQEMFDLLHDPVTGAGFSLLRLGIGSSPDSSSDHMNSIEPASPGAPSAAPAYRWDGNDSGQVWWAQEVQKRGVNLFYANSWGADWYMKTNNKTDDGGYLCGVDGTDCATGDWRQHYADKLVRWVQYYAEEGINITHLNPLNEPDIAVPYASMDTNGRQATDLLEKLTPAVRAAGLADLQVTCCDWAGWEQGRATLAEIQVAGGEQYLDVVSGHGYGQPLAAPYDTRKEVWQGEWAELSSYFDQPWYSAEGDPKGTYGGGEGITWAGRIMQGFTVANVSAFFNWMGAQPSDAATPVIRTVNDTNVLSKRYWAYAAFGRYARPGTARVTATSAVDGVTVAAWTPELLATDTFPAGGNLAVHLLNNGTADQTLSVTIAALASVTNHTAWLLNNEADLAPDGTLVAVDGTGITATVPAKSLVVLALDAVWLDNVTTGTSSQKDSESTASRPLLSTTVPGAWASLWAFLAVAGIFTAL